MLPLRCIRLHVVLSLPALPSTPAPALPPLSPPTQVSTTVLRRCMRTLPGLRNRLVGAFAAFVARIQEDYSEVVKDSLALLLR